MASHNPLEKPELTHLLEEVFYSRADTYWAKSALLDRKHHLKCEMKNKIQDLKENYKAKVKVSEAKYYQAVSAQVFSKAQCHEWKVLEEVCNLKHHYTAMPAEEQNMVKSILLNKDNDISMDAVRQTLGKSVTDTMFSDIQSFIREHFELAVVVLDVGTGHAVKCKKTDKLKKLQCYYPLCAEYEGEKIVFPSVWRWTKKQNEALERTAITIDWKDITWDSDDGSARFAIKMEIALLVQKQWPKKSVDDDVCDNDAKRTRIAE